MDKVQIRAKLKRIRHDLTSKSVKAFSQKICKTIQNLNVFKQAQHIGIYYPKDHEVNILSLISAHPEAKFYLPVIQKDSSLKFYQLTTLQNTQANRFNIIEPFPEPKNLILTTQLELIIFPILGFDKFGYRLGMGQGCYDRSFKKTSNSIYLGAAYSCQEVNELPHSAHDIPLDIIVTETQTLQFCHKN